MQFFVLFECLGMPFSNGSFPSESLYFFLVILLVTTAIIIIWRVYVTVGNQIETGSLTVLFPAVNSFSYAGVIS